MTTREMSLVVLAGGQSKRMLGRTKALLPLDGKPILQHALDVLRPLFAEVTLVTNDPSTYAPFRCSMVPDVFPGKGTLGGIHAGLRNAKTTYVFVVGCDMPFVQPKVVEYLVQFAEGRDAVVPIVNARMEPLHAVYSRFCLPPMEEALAADRKKVVAFLDEVSAYYVPQKEIAPFDPDLLSFFNVNTPQDYLWAAERVTKNL